MYMLAGGTDASNTDPYATKPPATNYWIKTGPHVMVVGATHRSTTHIRRTPIPTRPSRKSCGQGRRTNTDGAGEVVSGYNLRPTAGTMMRSSSINLAN